MLILKINWGLLWERPFYPEVWGTVSDWVMVFVTIGTAIFLIKTFLEQKKINDFQLENYRESILPHFTVHTDVHQDSGQGGRYLYVKMLLKENSVSFFAVKSYNSNFINGEDNLPIFTILKDTIVKVKCKTSTPPVSEAIMTHAFTFEFKDKKGNKYKQSVFAREGGLYLDLPALIKNN